MKMVSGYGTSSRAKVLGQLMAETFLDQREDAFEIKATNHLYLEKVMPTIGLFYRMGLPPDLDVYKYRLNQVYRTVIGKDYEPFDHEKHKIKGGVDESDDAHATLLFLRLNSLLNPDSVPTVFDDYAKSLEVVGKIASEISYKYWFD